MRDGESHRLLERVRCGDKAAAGELYDRYVDRLIELARSRLSPKLARRLDPEDIVQSAWRSFFRLARAGRYELGEGKHLWHLLAAITINKAHKGARRHRAQRRTVNAEESTVQGDTAFSAISPEAMAREPSPDEAAVLVEETERMMSRLSPLQRRVLQSRLQGHTTEETARQTECSERLVRRALELARLDLEQRLCESHPP